MASAATEAAIASPRGKASAAEGGLDAAVAAWLCAIPCAAIAAALIYLLGPPLSGLMSVSPGEFTFLPALAGVHYTHPEPTEGARYLVAMCVPLLGVLTIAFSRRWQPRIALGTSAAVLAATQWTLVGIVVMSIVVQYRLRFGYSYSGVPNSSDTLHYFSPLTLAAAAALTAIVAAVGRSRRLVGRFASVLVPESRRRRLLVGGVAVAVTVLWMLHAVNSDATIGNAAEDVRYHVRFTFDETFAVLNGLTPLVNFTTQYATLWPFAIALPMLAFGKTLLAFTLVMCALSTLALLAVYSVLRRVTGSAAAALLLYLPFLATSLFQLGHTLPNRTTVGTYYAVMPLRYGGPFFLAWLTARRIERGDARIAGGLLFAAAGLAAINNLDFGVAALGASVAAWLLSRTQVRRPDVARLAATVLGGLTIAAALVCVLTLVRAHALPQPTRLLDYPRAYAIGGFDLMPIPSVLGVHLLIYLTYVAAILAATVRSVRRAPNRLLTGMLVWAGVFGLGAGNYWVGRSHPISLKFEFPAWTFALALLTILAISELAAPRRRMAIGALVVVFGFGVATCSLAQAPMPWTQIARLQTHFVPTEIEPDPNPLVPPADARTRAFVATLADGPNRFVYKRGAPVAILMTTGHRAADVYGVVDVDPYTGIESLYTAQRVEATLDALRDAGGNTVIIPTQLKWNIMPLLVRRGFELVTADGLRPFVYGKTPSEELLWPGGEGIVKWVDTRHLHPRALR